MRGEGIMTIPQRSRKYLDSKGNDCEWLHHSEAFRVQEVAHSVHVSGRHFAKTVLHCQRLPGESRSRRLALLEGPRSAIECELKDLSGVFDEVLETAAGSG
jgi:hypothetical protein